MRYQTPSGAENEFQPGSRGRVLANLKGITRKSVMDKEEYDALVSVQEMYLGKIEQNTRFTAEIIKEMHQKWLGKLNTWAGKYS